jgi:quinolinate synthase
MIDEEIDDNAEMLMHWEVPGDTASEQLGKRKGMIGSTGDILAYVKQSKAEKFYLASECDFRETLSMAAPQKEFITPCIQCHYMKQNSIYKLLASLEALGTKDEQQNQITLSPEVIIKARKPVLRMMQYL